MPWQCRGGSCCVLGWVFQERCTIHAGKLGTLVKMDEHLVRRLASPHRHKKGLQNDIRCLTALHRPTNDTTRIQVDHDGQIGNGTSCATKTGGDAWRWAGRSSTPPSSPLPPSTTSVMRMQRSKPVRHRRVMPKSGFLTPESSCDQIDLFYLNTVFELYSSYHLGQVIEAA